MRPPRLEKDDRPNGIVRDLQGAIIGFPIAMGPDGGKHREVAQGVLPDNLDQSPEFDPTEPEPIPQDGFDQSWGA